MSETPEDPERETRIVMEAVVDAYDEYERFSGWYCYIEDKLNCPFKAKWRSNRDTDLEQVEEVEVIGMASISECEDDDDMLVEIRWEGEEIVVPLDEIVCVDADKETQEVVADWDYWLARSYRF